MRPNRNIRIGLALIGVAVLVWFVYSLRNILSPPAPAPEVQNVTANITAQPVVARNDSVAFVLKDIPERSIVTRDMLQMRSMPGADAASAVYVLDLGGVEGFITRREIPRGTPLRRSDLLGHITEVGIAGAVRPGFRAMAIPIVNKATLHDLVKVGDYVDVLAAFDQQESRTIVQNVRVLAVDVFGKDFPQVRVAQRGDYKADAQGIATANPPSLPGATGSTGTAGGQPAESALPPPPTPTPAGGQPPPRPEPSLTLEVTPEQATAIQLAQASSAPLDFILHPRPAIEIAPQARVAAAIRPRVAPYAERVKRGTTTQKQRSDERTARTLTSSFNNLGRNLQRLSGAERSDRLRRGGGRQVPSLPSFDTGTSAQVPPATIAEQPKAVEPPQTYRIPIYGDGKLVREDVVLKPID
jgi:Flp pilus assembly protein CpaB